MLALDQLTKSDPYGQSASTNTALTGGYQNAPYSSTQANKTASYPPTGAPQGYNNMSYSNNQVRTFIVLYHPMQSVSNGASFIFVYYDKLRLLIFY